MLNSEERQSLRRPRDDRSVYVPKEIGMETVTSRDGTQIAYDTQGDGPAIIVVDGALCTRSSGSKPELVTLLAPHCAVYSYDRRGRGDSGDTLPYAVEREVEDIAALIDVAGGTACLYGHSSGAVLALEAALRLGPKVTKLAMYDAPYNDDAAAQPAWRDYLNRLIDLLAANRRGDAVALFMAYVGMPAEQIEGMRQAPFWPSLEALGPTLAYDHAALLGADRSIPTARAARVTAPTLVLCGGASFAFMRDTALTLSRAIPCAQWRTLDGQTHEVHPDVLAPVLVEFVHAH
jgi:pimeloyl-ACP methyl ester carboxylesterase